MKPCVCGSMPVMVTIVRAVVRRVKLECRCGRTTGILAWRKPEDTLAMKEAAIKVWDALPEESS